MVCAYEGRFYLHRIQFPSFHNARSHFFLQLILSYVFKPHPLPHLDLGASASLVGLVVSVLHHAVRCSGTRPDGFFSSL